MPDNAPPSRARRLWVQERLRHARRAVDLLDRKRRILRIEEQRADQRRDLARAEWDRASRLASRSALMAQALAGSWAVEVAAHPVQGRADMKVDQLETVGVAHPGEPRLDLPDLSGLQAAAGGPFVTTAAGCHAEALRAAGRLAAAESTSSRLRAERLATERRQRAVTRVRIPALEDELRRLDERLDELERQEQIVTRWVSARRHAEDRGSSPWP